MLKIFGGLLLIALTGHWMATRSRKGPRNVLAIGDSLTQLGLYCVEIERNLDEGSDVTCRGLEGAGTDRIFRLLDGVKKDQYTDIIILGGVNDLASRRSQAMIQQNLKRIYEKARDLGARVIAVQVTPWSGHSKGQYLLSETADLNRWIRHNGIPSISVNTSGLGDHNRALQKSYSKGDGLHLSREGQKELGKLISRQAF